MSVEQSLQEAFAWLLRQREAFAASVAEKQNQELVAELPREMAQVDKLLGPPKNLAEWQARVDRTWMHLKAKNLVMGFAGPCGVAGATVGASKFLPVVFPRSGGPGALVQGQLGNALKMEIKTRTGARNASGGWAAEAQKLGMDAKAVYMIPYLSRGRVGMGFVQFKNLKLNERFMTELLDTVREYAAGAGLRVHERTAGALELRPTNWAAGSHSEWSARIAASTQHADGLVIEIGGAGHAAGAAKFSTSADTLAVSDFERVIKLLQEAVSMTLQNV